MHDKLVKDQISYLSKIKPLLKLNNSQAQEKEDVEIVEVDDLMARFDELAKRVSVLEENIGTEKEDSIRKRRVKEQIISALEQHKRLTSEQLGNIINLSRTRCNEYLRELTKEGFTEGVIVDRRKFYKLVKK